MRVFPGLPRLKGARAVPDRRGEADAKHATPAAYAHQPRNPAGAPTMDTNKPPLRCATV